MLARGPLRKALDALPADLRDEVLRRAQIAPAMSSAAEEDLWVNALTQSFLAREHAAAALVDVMVAMLIDAGVAAADIHNVAYRLDAPDRVSSVARLLGERHRRIVAAIGAKTCS